MPFSAFSNPPLTLPHRLAVSILVLVAIPSISTAEEPLLKIPVPEIGFSLGEDPLPDAFLSPQNRPAPPRLPTESSLFPEIDSLGPSPSDFEEVETAPDLEPESPADDRILKLARKVAQAVVSLRVWDEFGAELSSGVGVLVSADGTILTDAELLHPSLASEVDYITVLTGAGLNFRVDRVLYHDLVSGIALVGVDTTEAPFLKLDPAYDFAEVSDVTMVALHPSEGLSLNDARITRGTTVATNGWLELSGTDSPGAIGSPVFSEDGDVIGIIGLHIPLEKWMNLALPVEAAARLLEHGSRNGGQALDAFRRTAYSPVTRDSRFLAAWEMIQAAQYKSAARAFLDLTRRYPREASCWALLSLAAHEIGDAREAAASARMAVAINPAIGQYWKNFAALSSGTGDPATASPEVVRGSLEAATDGLPRDRASWLALAKQYVRTFQFENAERALRQVISLDADNGQALYLLAYTQGKLGKARQAQLTVARAVRVRPRDTESWFLMGLLYTDTRQSELAAEAFEKVVSLDPAHPTAWMNLAKAWKAAGNSTKALIAFRKYQETAR